MPLLELPHTAGCIVCGHQNPHGLHLSLFVDTDTGMVHTEFAARPENIGFSGIVHGGVLATVLDEAMVWAATWVGKRFCLCGELTTRFRRSAEVGRVMIAEAKVEFHNPKLIQTAGTLRDKSGQLLATASGKYVPVSADQNAAFFATLIEDATTIEAASILRGIKLSA